MHQMWAIIAKTPGLLALTRAWWEEPTTLWLGVGLSLILAEFVIPQLFVVFLGLGALAVSAAIYLGWISSPQAAVGVWVAASAALLWALRETLLGMPTPKETENRPEDLVAAGSYVQVLWVDPKDPHLGRVQYGEVQWEVWCPDSPLKPKSWVRLIAREGLGWLAEPSPPLEELDTGEVRDGSSSP